MEYRSKLRAAAAAALPAWGLATASGLLTLVFSELGAIAAATAAGLAGGAAFAAGQFWPARDRTGPRLVEVAGELEDYRAFPRLVQSQHDRVVDQTAGAVHAIAMAVRALDENAARVAAGIGDVAQGRGMTAPQVEKMRQEILDITQPAYAILAELQFQDITQQQLAFLDRLARLFDEHAAELSRQLVSDAPAARLDLTPFREALDAAMSETVMRSQRNDLKAAKGVAHIEDTSPAIELFV